MNGHFSKGDTQMADKHMIRCSTSLIFREVQIKTKMSYYLVHIKIAAIKKKQKITAVGEDVEKFKPLCAVAGTVKWSQPL